MTNYAELKKIDEESLQRLTEGVGPVDECLCPLFSPPEERKSFAKSVKKAFSALGKGKKREKSMDVPLNYNKDGSGFYTTKEVVQRQKSCGKCGCDNDKIVLKHSYANIRITSPDVSSICPCPSDCLPDKEKLQNNIKVIVENAQVSNYMPDTQLLQKENQ